MTFKYLTVLSLGLLLLTACGQEKKEEVKPEPKETKAGIVDEFADIKILQYEIPGWENLSLEKQKLVYYMTQAGLSGRDMMWAQNYRHNLTIRKALENVYTTYTGDKNTEDWKNFETFVKRIWFSNGIHHHYSTVKMTPEFSAEYLNQLLADTNTTLEGEAFEVLFNDKDGKKSKPF